MTITICHNKPPDRNRGWSVDDIMPGRDGPENLRILKPVSWDWTIEVRVGFWCSWVFRISTDIDLKHHKIRPALGWGQHSIFSIVWLAKTFKNYVSLLVSPWAEPVINKLFVPETTESACICICVIVYVLYYFCDWSYHGIKYGISSQGKAHKPRKYFISTKSSSMAFLSRRYI